ncbi:iron chelate uptake ABC transporter family permease subunit [Sporosarcina sp. JAI121]|uniref:FecCD family ABC transporter permease n=1 Tax=Sporosarcina sp. JAI121 TaxID=2723064 RepID=UPI0015C8FEF3|nr:iron ABC transporter permease [Sporosarcina sp. JAI121]NYF26353.1 iron complex transport system permease protein [Sporosarcina sp. JAI121]
MKNKVTVRIGNVASFILDKKSLFITMIATLLLGVVAILSMGSGDFFISPIHVLKVILGIGDSFDQTIIFEFRLPRIMMAILVGIGLATAGAILQSVSRNPLGSPDIIGITAGASFAVVLFLALFSNESNALTVSQDWMPLFAFGGAMITAAIVFALSWKNGIAPFRMLLIGIGISAFMHAGTTVLMLVGPIHQASQANIWITGSIYGSNWTEVRMIAIWITILFIITLAMTREMNVLELGDDLAKSAGSSVQRSRIIFLLLCTGLTGASVAFAGGIGFVGLIAPHIAKRIVGPTFGSMVGLSAVIGAIIVVVADWIARVAFAPIEVPAGVWTAVIGAPYFIYLLIKQRNR